MKNIISVMLIAALGALLVFSGCKEEEYVPEPLAKVTVSGTVEAQMDMDDVELEAVPNGQKIIFRIDSRDLVMNPIAGYAYQTLQYEATVTDGKYSIELPCVNFQAVNVDIIPVDFKANQEQVDNSFKEKTYEGNFSGVAIQEGERYFVNLTYGYTPW